MVVIQVMAVIMVAMAVIMDMVMIPMEATNWL